MKDFPGGSDGKASAYNVGDPGSIPGLGRSPGEWNGNTLHCYLEDKMCCWKIEKETRLTEAGCFLHWIAL